MKREWPGGGGGGGLVGPASWKDFAASDTVSSGSCASGLRNCLPFLCVCVSALPCARPRSPRPLEGKGPRSPRTARRLQSSLRANAPNSIRKQVPVRPPRSRRGGCRIRACTAESRGAVVLIYGAPAPALLCCRCRAGRLEQLGGNPGCHRTAHRARRTRHSATRQSGICSWPVSEEIRPRPSAAIHRIAPNSI